MVVGDYVGLGKGQFLLFQFYEIKSGIDNIVNCLGFMDSDVKKVFKLVMDDKDVILVVLLVDQKEKGIQFYNDLMIVKLGFLGFLDVIEVKDVDKVLICLVFLFDIIV